VGKRGQGVSQRTSLASARRRNPTGSGLPDTNTQYEIYWDDASEAVVVLSSMTRRIVSRILASDVLFLEEVLGLAHIDRQHHVRPPQALLSMSRISLINRIRRSQSL